mgnify:CR=1 FL=1
MMMKIDEIMDTSGQNMPNSAYSMMQRNNCHEAEMQRREQEENDRIERQNAPLLSKLQEQIDILKNESEISRKNEKSSSIVSWFSIGIAIVSLAFTMIAYFVG